MNEKYLEAGCEGMSAGTPPEPRVVVIFGASGDLAHRELIPSLYALACQKLFNGCYWMPCQAIKRFSLMRIGSAKRGRSSIPSSSAGNPSRGLSCRIMRPAPGVRLPPKN